MSQPTLTPDALRSEARPYDGKAWRLVEAQQRVSALKLVDSLAEQQALEDILEDIKPDMLDECCHLDYLLLIPFRYRPYPEGSRFRGAGLTPGVWYGAERAETAAAEMVFYRSLFTPSVPRHPFQTTLPITQPFARRYQRRQLLTSPLVIWLCGKHSGLI